MKNSICSACWQGWKHIMVWGVWQIRKIWAGDSEEPHHHFRPRHRCTVVQCCTVRCCTLYGVTTSVRQWEVVLRSHSIRAVHNIFSANKIFLRDNKVFLCERSACTCLATWAGWGSTPPPRPPTGPPVSVCLSMLLLTLFSISTGRTTAFCRGFLVVL